MGGWVWGLGWGVLASSYRPRTTWVLTFLYMALLYTVTVECRAVSFQIVTVNIPMIIYFPLVV